MLPDRKTLLDWIKPEKPSPDELKQMKLLRPGDLEIYSNKLDSILFEAKEVFIRTGIASTIRAGDLIAAIYTPAGDLVCASTGTFIHLPVSQLPVKFVAKTWLNDATVGVKEGDVFYANEALYGGIHNPDQVAVMPVFHNGELIAWTSAAAHQPETGGAHPGGMSPIARTKYWEGMRLPPIKIGENYQIRNDMLEMFTNFISRAPRMQEGDVRARVTACDRLRVRVQELVQGKGKGFLLGLFRAMLQQTEEAVRQRIRGWNDGTYRTLVFYDTTGMDATILRFYVTLHKKGDRMLFDFTGTSPEHDAGSHHTLAHHVPTNFCTYFFHHLFPDLPPTAGAFAPMDWIVPQGCVLNAGDDAAISNAPSVGCGVMSLANQIFSKLVFDSPERVGIAGGIGGGSGSALGGVNQFGVRITDLLAYPLNTEGQGGRVDRDGMDAYGFVMAPTGRAPDAEDVETHAPLLHLFQKQRRDSCGFGKYRGGTGTISAFAIHHVPQMNFSSTGRDSKLRIAQGIFGGYPGGVKFGFEVRNNDLWEKMRRGEKDLPKNEEELMLGRTIKGDYTVEHNTRSQRVVRNGDIFVLMSGGGAGYGDALERDPEKVVDDLKRQIISPRTVEHVYHVAYDPETLEVDLKGTEKLRRKERERRKTRGQRYQEFEKKWLKKRPAEAALKHYGSWPDAKKVKEIVRV